MKGVVSLNEIMIKSNARDSQYRMHFTMIIACTLCYTNCLLHLRDEDC